jgi:hypothetical protein
MRFLRRLAEWRRESSELTRLDLCKLNWIGWMLLFLWLGIFMGISLISFHFALGIESIFWAIPLTVVGMLLAAFLGDRVFFGGRSFLRKIHVSIYRLTAAR